MRDLLSLNKSQLETLCREEFGAATVHAENLLLDL